MINGFQLQNIFINTSSIPTYRNKIITYLLVYLSRNPSYIILSKSFTKLITKAFLIIGLTFGYFRSKLPRSLGQMLVQQ